MARRKSQETIQAEQAGETLVQVVVRLSADDAALLAAMAAEFGSASKVVSTLLTEAEKVLAPEKVAKIKEIQAMEKALRAMKASL